MKKIWANKADSFKKAEKFNKSYYPVMSEIERLETVQLLREMHSRINPVKFRQNKMASGLESEGRERLRKTNHEPRRAFTLIELIVVLAIVGMVFGMSFPFFAKFTKGSRLKNASNSISTVLRTARSYAISKRKSCWVIVNDQATSSLYYAVKIYNVDGTLKSWYKLPQGIEIDSTTFSTTKDVPFPHDSDSQTSKPVVEFKPTGGATANGSIYIKDSENNYKRIIVINVTGRVKVTDEPPP